jgi:hypothetical protein
MCRELCTEILMTDDDRQQVAELQLPLLRGMVQHLNYLRRVERTLVGLDDFTGTAHTDCALGRTMVAFHERAPAMLPCLLAERWWKLDRFHQEFHASSGLALTGRDPEAVDRMELQSLRIVELLGAFESDLDTLLRPPETPVGEPDGGGG